MSTNGTAINAKHANTTYLFMDLSFSVRGHPVGCSSQISKEDRHLKSRPSCIPAFVALRSAGTIMSLLEIIGRQYSKSDGESVAQRDMLNSACSFGRHVFEMGGFAPDDSTETNDSIVTSCFTQAIRYLGQFKRSWARKHLDILPSNAMVAKALLSPLLQLLGYPFVKAAHHDRKSQPSTDRASLDRPRLRPACVHVKSLLRIVSTMCMGTVKTPRA
jgi:hypothetical protein